MQKLLLILATSLLHLAFTGCGSSHNQPGQVHRYPDSIIPEIVNWQPLSDSGASVTVSFLNQTNGEDSVKWGNADFSRIEKLSSLTVGRAYKYPPQLVWQNSDFLCLMTNANGPFSEYLFLLAERAASPRFFAKDIEYTDTTFNFVLILDSVSETGSKRLWW
jgi:hypothetical protein